MVAYRPPAPTRAMKSINIDPYCRSGGPYDPSYTLSNTITYRVSHLYVGWVDLNLPGLMSIFRRGLVDGQDGGEPKSKLNQSRSMSRWDTL